MKKIFAWIFLIYLLVLSAFTLSAFATQTYEQGVQSAIIVGPLEDSDGAVVDNYILSDGIALIYRRIGSSVTEIDISDNTVYSLGNGRYRVILEESDLDSLSLIDIDIQSNATILPYFDRLEVVSTNIFSSLHGGGTDKLQVEVVTNSDKTGYTITGTTINTIVDSILDEPITGAIHNDANSLGKLVRQISSMIIREGTAQGAGTGNNQIQLDAGASAVDGTYDPSKICIIGNTGVGQSRLVLEYDGGTKTATVDRDWRVNPDATSEFLITPAIGREHVNEGLARGGSNNTITLNVSASATDDAYIGQIVFIRSGTGQDQARTITDYDGTSKVATVDGRNWDTNPDTTSGYVILPTQLDDLDTILENTNAIKTKTDNLPASPAATGAQMSLTDSIRGSIVDDNWLESTSDYTNFRTMGGKQFLMRP